MVQYTKPAPATTPSVPSAQHAGLIETHYEAAVARVPLPDCKPHILQSDPGLWTPERRYCEAFAELRRNIAGLVKVRAALLASTRSIEFPDDLSLERTELFMQRDYRQVEYGPRKELLLTLVAETKETTASLAQVKSVDRLQEWNAKSAMTVDDLIIVNGFFDYLLSYQARDFSPRQILRFGPFHERAFPEPEIGRLVVRKCTFEGEPMVKYIDLVSIYD